MKLRIDGVEHEGHSVIKVKCRDNRSWPIGPVYNCKTWGEAVSVDLGENGHLFGVLQRRPFDQYWFVMPLTIFDEQLPEGLGFSDDGDIRAFVANIRNFKQEVVVPKEWHPTLFRFEDASRPGSIEKIDEEDLGAMIGKSVSLEAVTIQPTTDPVTSRLPDILPWLPGIKTAFNGDAIAHDGGNVAGAMNKESFIHEGS